MEAKITAVIISATVSVVIVAVSRWIFSRSDRRFPILVSIQEQLLQLQKNPPWSTNGENIYFEKVREVAMPVQPYLDRLRMVSFPRRNCVVQRAWAKFSNIHEQEWRAKHPKRERNFDALTKQEFIEEVAKVLNAIKFS